MRPLLAALALLTLAACDSNGPEDALVGTWTLTSARTEFRVTSRTAQTVPDRSVDPTGAVAVSGATTATLRQVANVFADPDGNFILTVESASPLSASGYVSLSLFETDTESQATLLDADAGLSYAAYFTPRRALVSRDGGRFTVAPVTVSTGSATATASGTLVYPEIALAPGTPTPVQASEVTIDEVLRFTFGEDGAFGATTTFLGESQDVEGTWEIVGDGEVRVTATDEDGATETVTFQYAITGGTLVLEGLATDADFECADADCLATWEGQTFAEPGSISAVDLLFTYRFASRTQASARTAEAPVRGRRAEWARLPILGSLQEGR